jgi:hypothetical protein
MLRDGAHHQGIVVHNSALDGVTVVQEIKDIKSLARIRLYRYCRRVVIVDITSKKTTSSPLAHAQARRVPSRDVDGWRHAFAIL